MVQKGFRKSPERVQKGSRKGPERFQKESRKSLENVQNRSRYGSGWSRIAWNSLELHRMVQVAQNFSEWSRMDKNAK